MENKTARKTDAEANKALRRKRTMRYFIEATREIIATEGVSAVNTRSVAAKAGYTSGSIYEYFKSIDQLIAFATIDSIHDFLGEVAGHVTENTDPLEAYVITWRYFSLYAFNNPALYQRVVLLYGTDIISFLQEYYEVVPQERSEFPPRLKQSFFDPDRHERDQSILLQCAEKGYFRKEDVQDISQMANAGFLGCLTNCTEGQTEFDRALFLKMLRAVLLGYNPELAGRLDAIEV